MTLHSFLIITRHIANMSLYHSYIRPNAVCVSRKIYNDLSNELKSYALINQPDEYACEQINGLALFVDDTMPDEYYQVGFAKYFIDSAKNRQRKAIEGVQEEN